MSGLGTPGSDYLLSSHSSNCLLTSFSNAEVSFSTIKTLSVISSVSSRDNAPDMNSEDVDLSALMNCPELSLGGRGFFLYF